MIATTRERGVHLVVWHKDCATPGCPGAVEWLRRVDEDSDEHNQRSICINCERKLGARQT